MFKNKYSLNLQIENYQNKKDINYPLNILMVDDDPLFGRLIIKAASKYNYNITFCSSIEELSKIQDWNYDVAIVDYDLGAVTGFELTNYFENYTNEMPIILVSQTKRKQLENNFWSYSIRNFVHKSSGPHTILNEALKAYNSQKIANKSQNIH